MKNLILCFLFFPTLGMAAKQNIPNDVVYVSSEFYEYNLSSSSRCEIVQVVSEWARLGRDGFTRPNYFSLKCQTVYFNWSAESSGGLFEDSKYRATVEIYCKERDLYDQSIISLADSCMADPREECFSPQIKAEIKAIKPTVFLDINKPNVCN